MEQLEAIADGRPTEGFTLHGFDEEQLELVLNYIAELEWSGSHA